MSQNVDLNERQAPDELLVQIADYVMNTEIESSEAYDTARNCLMDTLAVACWHCAFLNVPST